MIARVLFWLVVAYFAIAAIGKLAEIRARRACNAKGGYYLPDNGGVCVRVRDEDRIP